MDSDALRPQNPPSEFRIRRKPVSNPNFRESAHADTLAVRAPATSSRALVSPPLSQPPSYDDLYGSALQVPQPGCLPRPRTADATGAATTPPPPSSPSPMQKAYGEARHFLGGLIKHPTVSNRHVTILRHSHGLVFYRGDTTSIAVSIFSDAPLPQDRTLWLQSKGWTGNTGMRTKALLRLNDSWLDVSPAMPLRADQVNPDDERAWQRDIKKFRKKAPPRARDKHQLRETAVARIPAEAGDGYFQLVLCQGQKKKVLGTSPVFRVLSISTNPHSLRGASLSTLPVEVGAMVLSLYAQTAARTMASPAAAAAAAKVEPFRPSWLTQTAFQKAYSTSGVQDRVAGAMGISAGPSKRPVDVLPSATSGDEVCLVEQGPQLPFPMAFKARCLFSHATVHSNIEDSTQLTLTKVPDWVSEQLRGYYFGWVRYETGTGKDSTIGPWCPSILSVRSLDPLQASNVNMAYLAKRVVSLRFLDEVPAQTSKLEVRLMGFLRSDIPPPTGSTSQKLAEAQAAAAEAALLADAYDVSVVQNTLVHPSWNPELPTAAELQRRNAGWMDRTRDGYANIQAKGQKWVEQVPLHRIGVRSAMDEWRESQVAVNGFYIVR